MDIYLYTVQDDPKKMTKTLGTGTKLTGTLRGELDIMRPEIMLDGNADGKNYMYIPDFGRYYFLDPQREVRSGLHTVTGREDVLMSWADAIKTAPAIVQRSENEVNAYIHDPDQPAAAFPVSSLYTFTPLSYPSSGSDKNLILITVG